MNVFDSCIRATTPTRITGLPVGAASRAAQSGSARRTYWLHVSIPHSRVRSMDPQPANQPVITLAMMRECFTAAVVCDALDAAGYPHQAPRVQLRPLTGDRVLIGRCKTTLWTDMAHADPRPYELELRAVDSCQTDDVLVAAAGGSMRSGIWGELLSTAARNAGCIGVIVDGAVRDVTRLRLMYFP